MDPKQENQPPIAPTGKEVPDTSFLNLQAWGIKGVDLDFFSNLSDPPKERFGILPF